MSKTRIRPSKFYHDNTVNEQILALIQAFSGSDYDQRSALGMARTWIDGNEPIFSTHEAYKSRDKLAQDLIAALEASGAEREEMTAALANARSVVNEPFRVDSFVGTAKGKPKEMKKGAESN